MSDNIADNRYCLDNKGTCRLPTQSMSMLPKSRPVLIKALESDEDDDDDKNEEPCKSKDESESEELSFLSQDDSADYKMCDIQEKSLHEANINSLTKSANELSKITCSVLKEDREIVTDVSVRKEVSCANDKEECKVDSTNFKSHLLIDNPSKSEVSSYKYIGKAQECQNDIYPLKNHQTDVHNSSIGIALPSPLLSVHKGDYNAKSDTNKNLQSVNSAHNENVYISDVLKKRKQEYMYNTPVASKVQLPKSDEYISSLNKEDSLYKDRHSFTEQASKNCKEESYTILNSESETASCVSQTPSGTLMQPANYNLQYSAMKYEANEKYTPAKSMEYSTPLLSKTGTINHLISETPLKHMQSTMHPNPSTSHKQLFQTPQSKPSNDLNFVHTPSTIHTNWAGNMRHVPMEGKNFITKDHVQASRNTIKEINEKLEQRFVIQENN